MSTSPKNMKSVFLFLLIFIANQQLFAQYNIGYIERGNAAYYADKLHGRPTASGEIYDKNAYTTAHKTIPFGTIVKITNLENGKSINVKVNDRGPFHPDKMVDISRVAAEYLDIIKQGVAPVQLEIMGNDAIVLPSQVTTQQNTNTAIDFSAPAVAINQQNVNNEQNSNIQQNAINALPKTQPYVAPKTRSVGQNLPKTSSLTSLNTIQASPSSIEIEQVGFVQRGRAAFYNAERNGKVTVTGEEYNGAQLVAAHPNIQLNSLVKVTNLNNGSEVTVRINDRPASKELEQQKIIILSEKAAETIGMPESGATDVKLEIINTGNNNVAQANTINLNTNNPIEILTPEEQIANRIELLANKIKPVNTYDLMGEVLAPEGFGIQVAAYNNEINALEKALEFEALQFKNILIQAGWSNGERSYRVLIGQFKHKEDTAPLMEFLKSKELKPFIRKHIDATKQ